MTYITCRLAAKNQDQLRNPTLCNRVWATILHFRLKITQHKSTDDALFDQSLTKAQNR